MANQDAAFGLRPLKTIGQQDDSTGFSSYWIAAGDASVIYQGSLAGFTCYRYRICRLTDSWSRVKLRSFLGMFLQ